jgi:hypothetical protein
MDVRSILTLYFRKLEPELSTALSAEPIGADDRQSGRIIDVSSAVKAVYRFTAE